MTTAATRRRDDDDNFDQYGTLKDGARSRVSMTMRDAATTGTGSRGPRGQQEGDVCTRNGFPGVLRRGPDGLFCDIGKKDAAMITDGHTVDKMALHKPGYRIATMLDKKPTLDAYQKYQSEIQHQYKCQDRQQVCQLCSGEGTDPDDDDETCEACGGTGIIDVSSNFEGADDHRTVLDRRTVDQRIRDHAATMAKLTAQRDAEDADAWRRG